MSEIAVIFITMIGTKLSSAWYITSPNLKNFILFPRGYPPEKLPLRILAAQTTFPRELG